MKRRKEWDVPSDFKRKMHKVARSLRRHEIPAEALLWRAIRNRQLEGRKIRRQVPIGANVVGFFCASERLVIEVDGPIHEKQREEDQHRQACIESLGFRFVRLANEEIELDLPAALDKVRGAFNG